MPRPQLETIDLCTSDGEFTNYVVRVPGKGWITMSLPQLLELAKLTLQPLTLDQANALITLAR